MSLFWAHVFVFLLFNFVVAAVLPMATGNNWHATILPVQFPVLLLHPLLQLVRTGEALLPLWLKSQLTSGRLKFRSPSGHSNPVHHIPFLCRIPTLTLRCSKSPEPRRAAALSLADRLIVLTSNWTFHLIKWLVRYMRRISKTVNAHICKYVLGFFFSVILICILLALENVTN